MIEYLKNLFLSSSIRTEIMKVINEKIDKAEVDFKAGVNDIKAQLVIDLEIANKNAQAKTKTLMKTLVKDVIGELTK